LIIVKLKPKALKPMVSVSDSIEPFRMNFSGLHLGKGIQIHGRTASRFRSMG
jgi:hypothetical protein